MKSYSVTLYPFHLCDQPQLVKARHFFLKSGQPPKTTWNSPCIIFRFSSSMWSRGRRAARASVGVHLELTWHHTPSRVWSKDVVARASFSPFLTVLIGTTDSPFKLSFQLSSEPDAGDSAKRVSCQPTSVFAAAWPFQARLRRF